MEKLAQNIQEAFLNNARKDKTFLTIYLMSGVKLSGRIKSFDKYSVVLETNNQEQLIFKHAISTVVVSKPFHASAGGHSSGAAPGAAGSADGHHIPRPRNPSRINSGNRLAVHSEERAILVGLDLKSRSHRGSKQRAGADPDTHGAEESLEEMKALADTAGAHVEETIVQSRQAPDSATLIGSGKLDELRRLVHVPRSGHGVVRRRTDAHAAS